MAGLPYITAPGNIDKAFQGIKTAATPERVSQDFVKTILKISGGSGSQVTAFLKKIGFANPDGAPSEIYKKFRNSSTSGKAAAQALKLGYAPLFTRNEYMYQLTDAQLKGLIIEETGQGDDSSVVALVLASIKAIKKHANWSDETLEDQPEKTMTAVSEVVNAPSTSASSAGIGLNLSYTINLNLPATSDVAVFNAIFKSLKENLLKASNEE